MSSSNPPNPNTPPVFNNDAFNQGADPNIDIAYLNANYLRFPTAQGSETLQNIQVLGSATFNNAALPTTAGVVPVSSDSSTKIPTTAWVQSAISGSSLLPLNNTWTGTNNFSNNVSIGSAGTANLTPTLTTYKTNLVLGTGGSGQLDVECPINVGGFGSINLLNADIQMNDDAIINQFGTRTIPNVLYSTNILNGSHIQYNSDNTQQTSAFTGAGALNGSYTSTNMTIDSNGKITAISNGTSNGDADMLYLTNTSGCLDASQITSSNWSFSNGFQPSGVRAIQTNSTGQYVAVAQNSVGYSFSSNYGQTFTTFGGVYASERTRGVAFSASGRYFLVQTGNGVLGQLYWSPNYGASFTGLIGGGITSTADVCINTTCIDADGTRFYTFNLNGSTPTLYRFILTGAGAITTATTTTFGSSTTFSTVAALKCSADGKYVIFNGQTGGINYIHYSSDYGATFTRVSTPANTTLGGGGQTVAMSKTGEIMVGVCRNTSTGNTVVFVSNNYGANWFSAGNILVNAAAGFIFDRIAMNGDGNIIIATATDTAGLEYFYATSNLGFTWYEATGNNVGQRFCCISNDGSLIYSQRPSPIQEFVFTSFPLHTSNTTSTQSKYNFTACPSYFEDFTGGSGTTMGTYLQYRFTGGGAVSVYEGATLNANIQSGYNGRIGAITMNSTTVAGDACLLATEETFRLANIKTITYGFNNCGNQLPTDVASGTDFGNGDIYMGLTSEVPNDSGTMVNTTILWRYSAPTGTVSNWALVENNVVKVSLSGANLTGSLSNKWIRCSIVFVSGGTQYYGIFNNLTNGVVFQTNIFTISGTTSINTNVCSVMGVSTSNATLKSVLMDYVLIEPNTLPINGGLSQTTSR